MVLSLCVQLWHLCQGGESLDTQDCAQHPKDCYWVDMSALAPFLGAKGTAPLHSVTGAFNTTKNSLLTTFRVILISPPPV